MNKLEALLLRNVKNPIVRSAIINLGLTVGVAVVEVIDAQVTNGEINLSLVLGAATLAVSKWVHSTLTDLKRRAEDRAQQEAVNRLVLKIENLDLPE